MESFADVWVLVKKWFVDGERLPTLIYGLWIDVIEPVDLRGDTAYLRVRTDFQRNMVMNRYHNLIVGGLESVLGFEPKLDVEVASSEETLAKRKLPMMFTGNSEYEYTFEAFVVGSSNKFAHAAALAVAANPSGNYNPLFIYGNSGLGKTHLLFAICNEIKEKNPEKNIIYCKGEEFTNEIINAIQTKTTTELHNKYRQADILAMDDIQFIGGKESTQEEFFHTFEALYQSGKQIILSSDRPPKEIRELEDRIRSRLEMGLTADIQPPDFESRIAIIRSKAESIDITIPDDVANFIASKLRNNIRQLEGTVKKLKAYQMLTGTPPTVGLAQTAIKDILTDNQPIPLTVEKVLIEASRVFGVSVDDIKSKKRSSSVSSARQFCAYIIREVTQLPMKDIGEELGGRDHSTIVYAIQKCEEIMATNVKQRDVINDIIHNIKNQ